MKLILLKSIIITTINNYLFLISDALTETKQELIGVQKEEVKLTKLNLTQDLNENKLNLDNLKEVRY